MRKSIAFSLLALAVTAAQGGNLPFRNPAQDQFFHGHSSVSSYQNVANIIEILGKRRAALADQSPGLNAEGRELRDQQYQALDIAFDKLYSYKDTLLDYTQAQHLQNELLGLFADAIKRRRDTSGNSHAHPNDIGALAFAYEFITIMEQSSIQVPMLSWHQNPDMLNSILGDLQAITQGMMNSPRLNGPPQNALVSLSAALKVATSGPAIYLQSSTPLQPLRARLMEVLESYQYNPMHLVRGLNPEQLEQREPSVIMDAMRCWKAKKIKNRVYYLCTPETSSGL